MKLSNNVYYIAPQTEENPASRAIANAMVLELYRYGLRVDPLLINAVVLNEPLIALEFCKDILKDNTHGNLGAPLFRNWEDRTLFTLEERVVQILGYAFQLGGNDLDNTSYINDLYLNMPKVKEWKWVSFGSEAVAVEKFNALLNVRVPQTRQELVTVFKLANHFREFQIGGGKRIYSDEVRIAVLQARSVMTSFTLSKLMAQLKCKPADALRYAATKDGSFDQVKLPSDVKYGKLSYQERVHLLEFLNSFPFDDLCEAMSKNQEAWKRFFNHIHLFSQRQFSRRFENAVLAGRVSTGAKMQVLSGAIEKSATTWFTLGAIDVTDSGAMVYRSFASRVQNAIDKKDFDQIQVIFGEGKNGGYLLRNLTHISNAVTSRHFPAFVALAAAAMKTSSADVLFSIIQINPDAKWRVIETKGNTIIQPANYSSVIASLRLAAIDTIRDRWGFDGRVEISDAYLGKAVPFLSKNSDLTRGDRHKFEDSRYLYFFMKWIESSGRRTDLDHSWIYFDENWNHGMVNFARQVNNFITHGGDFTSAPAPSGATEYSRIDLGVIPKGTQFVIPVINVFSGDQFASLKEAYAGFQFSDSAKFQLQPEHTRYDLTQPANSNIPFIIDVVNKEILAVDFNNRERGGCTAGAEIENIKKLIPAMQDKFFISIEEFATMLSRNKNDTIDLVITEDARTVVDITTGENIRSISADNLTQLFTNQ